MPTTTCVVAVCTTGGECTTANVARESSCAGGGGHVCDGNGACVGCIESADCPATGTACSAATCASRTCSVTVAALGTVCAEGAGVVCDGAGSCVATHCLDLVKDGDETAPDCGGATCPACGLGEGCAVGRDCVTLVCNPSTKVCDPQSCGDGIVEVGRGEQCDHGSANGTDGCSASCRISTGLYLDETESNDSQLSGNLLDGFLGAVGSLEPAGDVDWYLVNVTVPGSSITAEIGDGFGACPLGFDSRLSLYSPARALLATDTSGGVSPCSKIAPQAVPAAANLPVGLYALQVERVSGQAQAYYVLTVHVASPGCGDGIIQNGEQCDPGPMSVAGCSATCQLTGDFIPETEPNDTKALANPLGTHAGFVGAIKPAGDLDYFSFAVPGPSSSVTIQTSDGIGGCPTGFDSILTLYDPQLALLVADDNGGVAGCSQISPVLYPQAMNLPAGTYRVRVELNGNNTVQSLYVVTISVK